MVPESLGGHVTNKSNLIRVSAKHHFLIHVALSCLYEERELTTVAAVISYSFGSSGNWTSEKYEQISKDVDAPHSLVEQVVGGRSPRMCEPCGWLAERKTELGKPIEARIKPLIKKPGNLGNTDGKKYDNASPWTARRRELAVELTKQKKNGTYVRKQTHKGMSEGGVEALVDG
jgi:hypothetical protein